MLHKKKAGLLSQLESFITPLSEDAEGKLRGGFGGMNDGDIVVYPSNTACDNSPCSNYECFNYGCSNSGCDNTGCSEFPLEIEDSTTTDKVVEMGNYGLLI